MNLIANIYRISYQVIYMFSIFLSVTIQFFLQWYGQLVNQYQWLHLALEELVKCAKLEHVWTEVLSSCFWLLKKWEMRWMIVEITKDHKGRKLVIYGWHSGTPSLHYIFQHLSSLGRSRLQVDTALSPNCGRHLWWL